MIYTVTLNPALDKTVQLPSFCIGEVNRVTSLRTDAGGKGINVSKVLRQLGEPSVAAAILGGETGRKIAHDVEQLGIEGLFLFSEQETRTNLKIVDPVLHTNTDINEPGAPVNESLLHDLLQKLQARLCAGDLVAISGKAPSGASEMLYHDWILACKQVGADVFLDADGVLLQNALCAAPALMKPNQAELSALVGKPLSTEADILHAAQDLLAQGIECVVVTLGAEGALFCWNDAVLRAQSPRVPVGSTVGAGDSVVAALAYARQHGFSREDTARLAMATGSANVMCSGTQAAEYRTIEPLLPKVTISAL